jgi:signal peptide peptidase SppA
MTDRPATSVINAILKEPWAITENALSAILDIAYRENDLEAVAARMGKPLDNTRATQMRGTTAVIPITGPLFRRANMFTQVSGATSVDSLAQDFTTALNDPKVASILFDIDSPGGEVAGVPELAQMIHDSRGQKPIVAYAADATASGAYWLASAADEIVASETALLGSIGVIAAVADPTKSLPTERKKIQFVSSQSPQKRPDPTTEGGKAQIQQVLDDIAQVFLQKIGSYRGVSADYVQQNYGQGGVLVGKHAVAAGMADRIGSFEGTLRRLAAADRGRGALASPHFAAEDGSPIVTADGSAKEEEMAIEAQDNGNGNGMGMDSDHQAQMARSHKYGIGVKEGGNVTKPGQWKGVSDADFADPVNYRYPCHDKAHADNAASRWGDASNRSQYNSKEQGIIGGRIKRAQQRFGSGSSERDSESENEGANMTGDTADSAEPLEDAVSAAAGSPTSTDVHVPTQVRGKGGKKRTGDVLEASGELLAEVDYAAELAALRAENDQMTALLADQQESIMTLQHERDFHAAQKLVSSFITGSDAVDAAAEFYMALPSTEMKETWVQRERAYAAQTKDGDLFRTIGNGPGDPNVAEDPLQTLQGIAKVLRAEQPDVYKSQAQAFDAVCQMKEHQYLVQAYGEQNRTVR